MANSPLHLNHIVEPKMLSVIKLLDGVYIGNYVSANAQEFLASNKIDLIINCSPQKTIIKDKKTHVVPFAFIEGPKLKKNRFQEIFNLIESYKQNCSSVLLCSENGQTRAITCGICYIMRKFNWNLYRCLQYINSRRKNLEIRTRFLNLLTDYQKKHIRPNPNNDQWESCSFKCQEEKIVTNTFLNSRPSIIQPRKQRDTIKKKVTFKEHHQLIPNYYIQKTLVERPKSHQSSLISAECTKRIRISGALGLKAYINANLPNKMAQREPRRQQFSLTKNGKRRMSQKVLVQQECKQEGQSGHKHLMTSQEDQDSIYGGAKKFIHRKLSLSQPKSQFKSKAAAEQSNQKQKQNIYNVNINVQIDRLNIVQRKRSWMKSHEKLKMYLSEKKQKSNSIKEEVAGMKNKNNPNLKIMRNNYL